MLDSLQGHSAPPVCPASGGASLRSAGGGTAAAGAALGNNVKSVDHAAAHERNLSRFASKWAAANILKNHDAALSKRLSHCGYVARSFEVTLERKAETGAAGFDGLKTCASVWCCPCCSPRISARRKDELDLLMSGARAEGHAVVMLTLTARHDRQMKLAPFLDALKLAKKRLRQRREWRGLPFVGSVTATETTHGRNGWHPHFHEILLLDCLPADALALVEGLRAAWLSCLAAFGLSGADAAFQVQSAQAAGAYVAKFGAAEELALQGSKRGRNGSRGPWQLLNDARDGDAQAAAVWAEYALAFRGRRQLVWSRGLKARFGVGETSDDEAAAEVDPAPPAAEVLRAWAGAGEPWRAARRRRVALVHAAETGGDLRAAEYGLTDAERWRRLGGESLIDPPD
ncbi:protein rep [Paracoccus haematequi]|nr:protein rep [Paracoccus haematequi]